MSFVLPLIVIASMIFTSYLPAHLVRIIALVLPRSREQVSEAPLLRDSEIVRWSEIHAEDADTWSREIQLSPSCSFGVHLDRSTSLPNPLDLWAFKWVRNIECSLSFIFYFLIYFNLFFLIIKEIHVYCRNFEKNRKILEKKDTRNPTAQKLLLLVFCSGSSSLFRKKAKYSTFFWKLGSLHNLFCNFCMYQYMFLIYSPTLNNFSETWWLVETQGDWSRFLCQFLIVGHLGYFHLFPI